MKQNVVALGLAIEEGWTFNHHEFITNEFFQSHIKSVHDEEIERHGRKFFATIYTFKDGSQVYHSASEARVDVM